MAVGAGGFVGSPYSSNMGRGLESQLALDEALRLKASSQVVVRKYWECEKAKGSGPVCGMLQA